MGDALAVVLLERKGFTPEDFALFHPAGTLGKRLLLKVSDIMHTGEALPLIPQTTGFLSALLEISTKKLGMGIIVDEAGQTLGILTDGDIRRALTRNPDARTITLPEAITRNPRTIDTEALAVSALRLMEERKITVLLVTNGDGKPEGVIHMHDILKTGIS